MAFAAGAIVFPGGRIDAGDHLLVSQFPHLDSEDAAGRIAAIRETIEEAGVAVGMKPMPPPAMVAKLRRQLEEGIVFADALAAAHLRLDPDSLVPFARWCPRLHQARNFDTRFYIARAEGGQDASVDASENVRLFWSTARDVIDAADAGRARIIFPTRRNLERLALLGGFDAAAAEARRLPVQTITPWIEERADGRHLCIPSGAGYPITAEPVTSAMRG